MKTIEQSLVWDVVHSAVMMNGVNKGEKQLLPMTTRRFFVGLCNPASYYDSSSDIRWYHVSAPDHCKLATVMYLGHTTSPIVSFAISRGWSHLHFRIHWHMETSKCTHFSSSAILSSEEVRLRSSSHRLFIRWGVWIYATSLILHFVVEQHQCHTIIKICNLHPHISQSDPAIQQVGSSILSCPFKRFRCLILYRLKNSLHCRS